MKILKIVGGVVVVLIAVVVVVLLTFDVGQYKGLIQDQAKAATGREVTIGDIKLSISLTPAIVVSDVKVANAPWGSRAEMVILKRLEAQTQLIPLLFGTINIRGLKLVEPDVVLETNPQGKGNWEFDTQTPAGGEPLPLSISGVAVEGLKLAYHDGKTKGGANVAAKAITVKISGAITDLLIPALELTEATASYKQGAMAAEGSVAKLALNAVGPITAFNLTKLDISDAKGSFKDGPAAYEGAVASLAMAGDTPAGARSGAVDMAAALQNMNLTKLTIDNASGSLKDSKTTASAIIGKLAVEAKGRIGDLGITNLSVTTGKASYKGEGAPLDVTLDKLSLDASGVLSLAAKVSGQDVQASGTLAPIATLAARNKAFPAKLSVEGFGLKADTDLMVDLSKKRPGAKGTLTIPELDLAAFAKTGAAGKAAPQAAKGAKVFSDEPLPWDMLSTADVDMKVSLGKLTLPNGVILKDIVLPVDLAGGKGGLKAASLGVAGGTVTADLALNAGDKSMGLKLDAKGVTAETLAKELKQTDLIAQGPIDLKVDVRGSGHSQHAVMASLNGSVIGGMGESKIRSDALKFFGADALMQVASAINPMGNKDPYTVARCGVVNLQIAGGVATSNAGIALETDKMQLSSSGKIDLGDERVDLTFRPRVMGGLGLGVGNLAQAVKLSGPLTSPGVGIDKAGAVKTLSSLGAAFATGGVSLLAQGVKEKSDAAAADVCQTARSWHLKK